MDKAGEQRPVVRFEEITAKTVVRVCKLSETLSQLHRTMVADNAISIAQAHFSEGAWMRAIYAGDVLVGFLMLHIGPEAKDGIDCPGAFLWRFMIAGDQHGKGYGRAAIELLCDDLRTQGVAELYVSYEVGEGSPEGFYRKLGFVPTGGTYGGELEAVRQLAPEGR